MGFSTSAVVAIFTASIMYMASMFYPLADMSNKQVHEAERFSNELWEEKLNTKIVITNWSSDTITVYNNGSFTLNSSKITLMLDGELISSFSVTPGGVWSPEKSIDVNIGATSGRVKIITANGAADYMAK